MCQVVCQTVLYEKNYPLALIHIHAFFIIIGMVIGFSFKEYTTTESLGEVSVCVKILNSFNGEALEPFTIALLPDEGIH